MAASEPVKSTKPAEARKEASKVDAACCGFPSANVLIIHEDPLASLDGLSCPRRSILVFSNGKLPCEAA